MNNHVPRGFARHFSNSSLGTDEPQSETQERSDRRKKYFCSVCKAQKDLERGGGTPIYGLA